jgi:hypothetical protein
MELAAMNDRQELIRRSFHFLPLGNSPAPPAPSYLWKRFANQTFVQSLSPQRREASEVKAPEPRGKALAALFN